MIGSVSLTSPLPALRAPLQSSPSVETPGDTYVPGGQEPAAAPPAKGPVLGSWPREIILIRHAEKPGLDESDDEGSDLTPQGQERAQALATALPQRYPDIDMLIASSPHGTNTRTVSTIVPLSKKLGLPINADYGNHDYAALAQALKTDPQYAGKTIVICWHHGKIPRLARAIGVTPPTDPWPSNEFDRIWQIDFGANGQPTVQNLAQHVLPGDSNS